MITSRNFIARPGDIFLTRGKGLFSYLIRVGTSDWDEAPSIYNHAGIVISRGTPGRFTEIIESLWKFSKGILSKYWHDDARLIILQANLTDEQREGIVREALKREGKLYDWLQIGGFGLGHALSLFGRVKPIYRFFRNNVQFPDREVCSTIVSVCYREGAGIELGEKPSPDDLDDLTRANPQWRRWEYRYRR